MGLNWFRLTEERRADDTTDDHRKWHKLKLIANDEFYGDVAIAA